MKIQKIVAVYTVALGMMAFLSMQFPSKIASFVNFFLPLKFDLTSQDFIRYRMALFLTATIVFLALVPIILRFGFHGTESEKIKRIHWRYIVIAILVIPIGWIGFPFIALCTTCWTANDIFYFFFIISVFIGLQILLQALLLKINLFKNGA